MKKQKLLKQTITAFFAVIGMSLFAQDVIILSPKDMIPADTGYYIGGNWSDEDDDGVPEFYNGCFDAYGDANHNEAGTQQGFYYHYAMIMPTCWPKDAVENNGETSNVTQGYIELGKTKYTDTYGTPDDSSHFCYLITPAFTDLDSMMMEVSPDITPLPNRHIYWDMEISPVNDTNWSGTDGLYIRDETLSKNGDVHHYNVDNPMSGLEFEDFMTASKAGPIIMRILATDQSRCTPDCQGSCRVKIHHIKIYAKPAATAVKPVSTEQPVIHVANNVIYSESGKVFVYNTLGQYIGSGASVAVPAGIYIVRHPSGSTRKIIVE